MTRQAPFFLDAANAAPGTDCFAVTPSDSENMIVPARLLYVGSGGDVTIMTPVGNVVRWALVPSGGYVPCACIRVMDTGTTADRIVAIPFEIVPLTVGSMNEATIAWIMAVESNGGTVSNDRQFLVNELIVALIDAGVWDLLDGLEIFAAENEESALTDMKSLSLSIIIHDFGPAPTFIPDRGYDGLPASGSTVYTGYNPTVELGNYVRNDATMFGWTNTAGIDAGGLFGLSTDTIMFPEYTDGNCYWQINGGTAFNTYAGSEKGKVGLYQVNRTGANTASLYINNIEVMSDAGASNAVPSNLIYGLLSTGGGTFYDGVQSALGWGGSMNLAQRLAFYTAMRAYMTAVGVS